MKRVYSNRGLSLVELMISMMLIAVLLLGIYVINSVLGNNNLDYGQRYLVKSETQTTLNHILNNASLAIGSGTTISALGVLDQGILIGTAGMGDANSMCIHQDIAATPPGGDTIDNTPANNTPANYNDDRWLCYTWYPSTDPSYPYQIRYCAMSYLPTTAPYRGAASCTGVAGSLYLGTSTISPIVSFSAAAGGVMSFNVSISNCLNNSATSTCTVAGSVVSSTDLVNNPVVTITGSVNPPQEGMQQT